MLQSSAHCKLVIESITGAQCKETPVKCDGVNFSAKLIIECVTGAPCNMVQNVHVQCKAMGCALQAGNRVFSPEHCAIWCNMIPVQNYGVRIASW